MFVHSGASLHGHEYSTPSSSPSQHRRFPSMFPAGRPLSDVEPMTRQFASSPSPSHHRHSLPARPQSDTEPIRYSSLSTRRRTPSDTPQTVRFRDPQPDISVCTSPSEDEESVLGSEISDQTDGSIRTKKRKRTPRKSTRFALAYPAPQLRTKQRSFLQIRPRVWLQLQEVSEKRAIPAFDVIPSSIIAGSFIIPKLAKKFPRMFLAKPHLDPNDLLLVRSEDYSTSHLSHGTSSGMEHKDVLAVISPTSDDDCVEIVFQDGSIWMTHRMANGSYEFSHVNEQGETMKARWVKRALTSPRVSWASSTAAPASPVSPVATAPDVKWTFSIIDPSTRRHPIQGVLTSAALDIYDTYNTMSTSSGRYPPTRPFGSDISGASEDLEERMTMEVSQENKTLMLTTAVWVGLRQKGWPATATPKFPRAVSQYCGTGSGSSERSQTFPLTGTASGRSSPQDTTAHIRPVPTSGPEDRLPDSGMIRRAVSSGSEFMKRRREAFLASTIELDAESEKNPKMKVDEEETYTCGLRLRRWTWKLFHPRRAGKDL